MIPGQGAGQGNESARPAKAVRADRELWWSSETSTDDAYAVSLGTLGALSDLELDALSLVQRAVAVRLDGRVVDENVLAAVHGDEAVALLVVEPLHGALCHVHSLLGAFPAPPFVVPGSSLVGPASLQCTWAVGPRGTPSAETLVTTTRAGRYTARRKRARLRRASPLAVELRHGSGRIPLARGCV